MRTLLLGTTFAALIGSLSFTAANADSLDDATNAFCEKQKQCVMEEVNSDPDSSEDEKQMMLKMTQSMCGMITSQFQSLRQFEDIIDAAGQCLKSMAELSCDEIAQSDDFDTPQCEVYEKAAAKYQ